MVFSSALAAAAARAAAELCQREPGPGHDRRRRRRLRADEVLRALFLPPVRELERLAGCVFLFFCLPLPEHYVPGSGRGGGWVSRPPGAVMYNRRSLSLTSASSFSSSSSSVMVSSSSSDDDYEYYYSDD